MLKLCVSESWTLTKLLSTKPDGNHTRMIRATLNVSWRSHINQHAALQQPTEDQVSSSIAVSHAGRMMSQDEITARVLL